MEYVLENRQKIMRKIGGGSQGDVQLGIDMNRNNNRVAIKMERKQRQTSVFVLNSRQNKEGFPEIQSFGADGDQNQLVMQLLSRPLDWFFEKCGNRFELRTIVNLGTQMLARIETLHNSNYIHRDIKPENFMMGSGPHAGDVFLIDLGLSKKYKDSQTHQHTKQRHNAGHVGTLRQMSINTHNGVELSRRDDMEGILQIIILFFKGKMPWQGIKAREAKIKQQKISEKKMATPVETLCQGLPTEISVLMNQVRNLKFEDRPDQTQMKSVLGNVLRKQMLQVDKTFQWANMQLEVQFEEKQEDMRDLFEDVHDAHSQQDDDDEEDATL